MKLAAKSKTLSGSQKSGSGAKKSDVPVVIAVDVGTAALRAAVFDITGRMLAIATRPVGILEAPVQGWAEHSTEIIWRKVCEAVRDCWNSSGLAGSAGGEELVKGIAFDATSSLVVLGENDAPLPVTPGGKAEHNVIMWMDRRAIAEANEINQVDHEVLRHSGGRMSPDMQVPKLLWLKRQNPDIWSATRRVMDLADYLTYRATGRDVRSLSTLASKWGFLGHLGTDQGWSAEFLALIGLEDLHGSHKMPRTGSALLPLGSEAGVLVEPAAAQMGMPTEVPVGVGVVNAIAGGIGALGASLCEAGLGGEENEKPAAGPDAEGEMAEGGDEPAEGAESGEEVGDPLDVSLAIVSGMSTHLMALSREPRFVHGVRGPYFGALLPELWLNEGDQNATGAIVDFLLERIPEGLHITKQAKEKGQTVQSILNECVSGLRGQGEEDPAMRLHVLPYHRGNRSPRGDPAARGMIDGIRLANTLEAVAAEYLAHIQAISYGSRHVIYELNEAGYSIQKVYMCGGGARNRLIVSELADACGVEVLLPREPEATLLGDAILAAVASGVHSSMEEAMGEMCHVGERVLPRPEARAFHDFKYEIFLDMYAEQTRRRAAEDKWRKEQKEEAEDQSASPEEE